MANDRYEDFELFIFPIGLSLDRAHGRPNNVSVVNPLGKNPRSIVKKKKKSFIDYF